MHNITSSRKTPFWFKLLKKRVCYIFIMWFLKEKLIWHEYCASKMKYITSQSHPFDGRKIKRPDSVLITKTLVPTENKKKQWQPKNATKHFDCITIADRLRTVSVSNNNHPTGMVKPVYGSQTFPLTTKAIHSKEKKEEIRLSPMTKAPTT